MKLLIWSSAAIAAITLTAEVAAVKPKVKAILEKLKAGPPKEEKKEAPAVEDPLKGVDTSLIPYNPEDEQYTTFKNRCYNFVNDVVDKAGYRADRIWEFMPPCEWEQEQCDYLQHELEKRMEVEDVMPDHEFKVEKALEPSKAAPIAVGAPYPAGAPAPTVPAGGPAAAPAAAAPAAALLDIETAPKSAPVAFFKFPTAAQDADSQPAHIAPSPLQQPSLAILSREGDEKKEKEGKKEEKPDLWSWCDIMYHMVKENKLHEVAEDIKDDDAELAAEKAGQVAAVKKMGEGVKP